jgi:peptide/nickel transport system ATP-binding protein
MHPEHGGPLLNVEHLRTVFRLRDGAEAAAVEDVSFSITRGETLGLVGESGSGKSVTALSLIGLVAPPGRVAGGQVAFDGRNLLELDDRALCGVRGRHIGFIFQEPMVALDPVFTIGAQIAETLQVHGIARGRAARRRAVELLDAVRIPDPNRRANERAMIALALSGGPELVIADEPTTALDVTVQAEILELLRDMRRQLGLSLLLITHDLGVIAEMADRVAVMYAGRIVEHGDTRAVLRTPAHPYTQALLSSIPGTDKGGRLRAIPGVVPPLGHRPGGCAFAPRCEHRFAPCDSLPSTAIVADQHAVTCFLHGETPR